MNKMSLFSALLEQSHPGERVGHRLQRQVLRTTVRLLQHTPYVTDWYPIVDDPLMRRILTAHPRICEKVVRPYLRCGLSHAERHRRLIGHYRWLRRHLSDQTLADVYLGDGLELARLLLGDAAEYRLVLHYLGRFEMEGDLTLSLMRAGGPCIFSLTFTMLEEAQGLGVHIGGAQGGPGEMTGTIRQLTKAWHGMRPKTLVLCALMRLANSWGASRLSGIGGAHHVYRCRGFRRGRKDRILADYDSLWIDAGGRIDAADPRLYALPLAWPMRPMDTVSSHKRAMYRRRYAMLELLTEEVGVRAGEALGRMTVPVHIPAQRTLPANEGLVR